ncbi:MAG: hypothetical protein QOE98_809 [Gaiellaceae bacterium]|nr:hypothetical protein [Gaiellaceae bacterium]
MKRFVFGALAAVLLVVPVADAKSFKATVVKRNVATRTVVVATHAGTLKVIHNRRDRVGTVLRINGSRIKAVGRATRVRVKGVVTKRTKKSFNVSAGGAVVKIRARGVSRVARSHGHRLGKGLRVTARVSSNGTVTEVASAETDDVEGAEIEGTLACTPATNPDPANPICVDPNILKIDIGSAAAPLLIPVMFDPALFPDAVLTPLVGQKVEARTSLAPSLIDQSAIVLTLTAIDSEASCRAEDEADGDNNDGEDNGGGGGDDRVARHGDENEDGCQDDD